MSVHHRKDIQSAISTVLPEIVAIRHHLHRNPEISDHEEKTSAYVAEMLRSFGMEDIQTNVGGYGIIANLHGTAPKQQGRTIAIRADMDALPIQEESDLPYRSTVPGVMHACGHDGHTSTLLGTVAVLSKLREQISGTVRFVFQPAEETVGGAARMVDAGALEGVESIIALHGWPGLKPGQIGVRSGAMMASSDTFDIVIKGKGVHAAMPQGGVDPVFVGAHLVLALQSLSSREIAPTDPVVVTISQIHTGTAYNVIPEIATLKGTVRCLSRKVREEMPEKMERIIRGICDAFRAEYSFRYRHGVGVTVNDGTVTEMITNIGNRLLGSENVVELEVPSMGAEDFSVYLEHIPGMMFRLGVGANKPNLHNPSYDFGDEAIPVGIEMFAESVLEFFGR
ncbi:MAG: amidohydrolase [Armatimonadetes bacterium]|nr:amidohydrolase [Armatimonadota bacterium]